MATIRARNPGRVHYNAKRAVARYHRALRNTDVFGEMGWEGIGRMHAAGATANRRAAKSRLTSLRANRPHAYRVTRGFTRQSYGARQLTRPMGARSGRALGNMKRGVRQVTRAARRLNRPR